MYGEGLAKLEGSISVEVEKLFERFDENKDEAFNPEVDLCEFQPSFLGIKSEISHLTTSCLATDLL